MKLAVQNIVDWLEEHGYTVHSSICTTQANLTGCKWLYSDTFEHGVLYIEPPDENLYRREYITVVTYGNDILRVEAEVPEELFNTISAAFYYYADWERRLLACILYKHPLQELIQIADEVFQAPLIVDGIDGQCYGITRNYPPEIHETWRMRLENDAESYDFVRRNANRAFSKRLVRSFFPEFNDSEVWPGNTMYSNLFYNGQRAGFIVAYEYEHKMRPGDLYHLYTFARIVEQHIAQQPEKYCYTTYLEFFLFSALHRGLDNWEKLDTVFRHNHWKFDDSYRVCFLLPHAPSEFAEAENAELLEQISARVRLHCPDAVCMIYQSTLTVLVNLSRNRADYTEQLLHRSLHVGESMPFRDIRRFCSFQQQAADTAEAAREQNLPCLDASKIISQRIARELRDNRYARSYIPQELIRLADYDAANRTELLPTVRAFAMCNLNSTDTARYLGIHRNTLLQRLHKTHGIIGSTAENLVEFHGFCATILYCSLLLDHKPL